MSQIGFILVGVGMQGLLGAHNQLAVYGTVLHMVNHSLIKLILFVIAGVIFTQTESLNLNEMQASFGILFFDGGCGRWRYSVVERLYQQNAAA